jgi:hypothetical protein
MVCTRAIIETGVNMTKVRARVACALLAGLLIGFLASPSVAEVKIYPTAREVHTFSEVKLGKDGRKMLSEFKTKSSYFGALHYNATDDVGWYFMGLPSLQNAIAVSKSMCEIYSKTKGQCVLLALALPKGLPPSTRKANGLSQLSSQGYQKDFKSKWQQGKYSAYYQHGLGGYGFAHGHNDKQHAQETAQLFCLAEVAKTIARLTAEERKLVMQVGANACELVEVKQP